MDRSLPDVEQRMVRVGHRGILAHVPQLDRWLHVVLVALVLSSALRYVSRHDLDLTGVLILLGAASLIAMYAARPLVRGRSWWPTAWVALSTVLWAALTLMAPSFAWTAVPLAFAALEVLAFTSAVVVVMLMTVVASAAWLQMIDGFDPTVVVGPLGIALVTVIAYRALEREASSRQRLLDELTAAQEDLAAAQRHTGALAERTRLSREIHDSVGQGLTSINLLLTAAEQDWKQRPDVARSHVGRAAASARSGLEEVRRVVRDLAPAELVGRDRADSVPVALERIAAECGHGLDLQVRVHGTPAALPPELASAVVRSARGALANVMEHAAARQGVLTLTYDFDQVRLDVRDDGRGFDPLRKRSAGLRGHGLDGLVQRAASLGGRAVIESAPGEGTTVSVAFPLETRGRS